MARLNTLLFLVVVALSVVALIDCLATDRSQLRSFPRGAWVILILLCPVAGAIAWFRGGRATSATDPRTAGPHAPGSHTAGPHTAGPHTAGPHAAGAAQAGLPGPIGPEDDPAFVQHLADTLRNR
ncbi:PLDc N-terminal domain-containing protein [Actinoplanes sp. DH11]|uniref:PLDc N-terminal domain-containing protein n=1 Tax=Actinoplanes sp. DH11 TaxID=2857011 RepID=UPI001E38304D|nr:PLDc N-terminal domain-containing protein [Actinoplanes sp. DH11]